MMYFLVVVFLNFQFGLVRYSVVGENIYLNLFYDIYLLSSVATFNLTHPVVFA